MHNETPISSKLKQFFICLLIIGVTLISFPTNDMTYMLVRFVQVLDLLIFALLILPNIKQAISFDKLNLFVTLWWIVYLINTLLHPTDVGVTPIFTWLNVAIFLLIGKKYWAEDMRSSLKILSIIFSLLIYINAILLILFPEGLWIDPEWVGRGNPTRYLFGNQNQTGLVCLLAITTQCMYTFAYGKGHFNLVLLLIISLSSVLFLGSMTSAIGMFLITTYIVFNRLFKNPKVLLIIFTILYVCIFLLLIWYGNDIEQVKWATTFIEGTLSKDTTFSKRTVIWANAVELIRESPVLGYGIQSIEWNDDYLEGSGAHNLWVMLLLNGGMVACFAFIFITIFAIREALSVRSRITTVSVMALCVLFVMSFFEAYNIIYIFLFLQIVYYSSSIPLQIEKEAL